MIEKKFVYLLKKHPRNPFGGYGSGGHLEAFTVDGIYSEKSAPTLIAKEKNKKSSYLWTVSRKEIQ